MSDIESVITKNSELFSDNESQVITNSVSQIGLIDCKIKEDDVIEIEDIILGGDFLSESNIPEALLRCPLCQKIDSIRLILKIFNPTQKDSQYCLNSDDRWLYILQCASCLNKDGSIRCIRHIKYNDSFDLNDIETDVAKDVLNMNIQSNPFDLTNSSATNPFAAANPFASSNPFESKPAVTPSAQLENTKVNNEKMLENQKKQKHDLKKDLNVNLDKAYTPYFIYLEDEKFNPNVKKANEMKSSKINYDNIQIDDPSIDLKDIQKKSSDVKEQELDPMVNKLTTSLTDPQFNKFINIIEYNSDQILRLSPAPIFFKTDEFVKTYYQKKKNNHNIPKLKGSSSPRTFELQLMPYAISKLESNLEIDLKNRGMEWGTILVFTDSDNYVPSGKRGERGHEEFVEEFVHVQWDD
ncbi:uncharacterized protein HGUI_01075 [Hanseniaspora guilliermondii]|uniref:Programmed cell death protein 2 C-terminal domain-containing protein n=1 Tax=Hanseniaspora guilliermondii TaxID=56406 RepID=A0A1L0B1M0_9ASCO|nr:uncharacterized protein HGUI_01075 [Hanseniaspora guilliermondii]